MVSRFYRLNRHPTKKVIVKIAFTAYQFHNRFLQKSIYLMYNFDLNTIKCTQNIFNACCFGVIFEMYIIYYFIVCMYVCRGRRRALLPRRAAAAGARGRRRVLARARGLPAACEFKSLYLIHNIITV